MNPTNGQELREWLAEYATSNQGDGYYVVTPDDVSNNEVEELQALIAAHTNAEIAKVLDRLEAELNEQKKAAETNLAYHTDVTKNERLIRDWRGTVDGIEFCRPAIQAERAKLKEVK